MQLCVKDGDSAGRAMANSSSEANCFSPNCPWRPLPQVNSFRLCGFGVVAVSSLWHAAGPDSGSSSTIATL